MSNFLSFVQYKKREYPLVLAQTLPMGAKGSFGIFPSVSNFSCTDGFSTSEEVYGTDKAARKTDAFLQTILQGRKSWKTIKGKTGEPVWPLSLEAAFIKGLAAYCPDNSNATLGRFPRRNKFVSDFIFKTTGHRRTPKQVGSRIQQLRDTTAGKEVLDEINRYHQEKSKMSDPSVSSRSHETLAHLDSPSSSGCDRTLVLPNLHTDFTSIAQECIRSFDTCSLICIDIYPEEHHCLSPTFTTEDTMHTLAEHLPSTNPLIFRSFPAELPLKNITPTVTFTATNFFTAESIFTVFLRGSDRPIHQEVTSLDVSPLSGGLFLFRTTLVPQYWRRICDSNDPTQYTIVQTVAQLPTIGTPFVFNRKDSNMIYYFRYSEKVASFPSPTGSQVSLDFEITPRNSVYPRVFLDQTVGNHNHDASDTSGEGAAQSTIAVPHLPGHLDTSHWMLDYMPSMSPWPTANDELEPIFADLNSSLDFCTEYPDAIDYRYNTNTCPFFD